MHANTLKLSSVKKKSWPTNVTTKSTGNSYILLPQKFGPTYVGKLRKQGPLVHTITSNTSDTKTYTF